MKRAAKLLMVSLAVVGLLAGCRSPKESEAGELRRGMNQQVNAARAQLQAAGASPAQLREFDRAAAALNRQMRQLERQMQAMEKMDAE